jgi:hypothetical protein
MMSARPILVPLLAALAALTLLIVPVARAQQDGAISVRVEVPQKMYVGDSVDLSIAVTGSRNLEAPDLSGLKDFDAVYRAPQDSSSTMTTIINGRVSTKVTINFSHLYSLTPRRAGQFEFPALNVIVDGRSYTTSPVPILVVEPTEATDCKLTVTADTYNAYVGQPITLTLVWQLGENVQTAAVSLPISGPDHEFLPGPQTRQLTGRETGGIVQLPLNGQSILALHQNGTIVIDRVIVPTKPGVLVIGPSRVDFLAVLGYRERSPFDSIFSNEGRAITDRRFSPAPQIVIPVSELPAAGKPPNFSGLVGAYTINASADTTNIAVGDPINLSVGVSGPYPLSLVPPLDLAHQSSLKGKFRIPREPALPQLSPSSAAFSAMIRARSPEVKEIGPITLNYFDPDSKTYKTASTRPIPLTVRASTSVTLPDEPDEAAPAVLAPEKRPGGLPDIDRSTPYWTGETFDIREKLLSPTTILLLLVPPLACAIAASFIAFLRYRERDPAARRRRAALARLKRDLRRARGPRSSLDHIARALSNFAADSFDEPRNTLTGTHAAALLSRSGTPAGTELATLLHACDETRFGVGAAPLPDRDSLARQAIAAAKAFADQLRRRAPTGSPA